MGCSMAMLSILSKTYSSVVWCNSECFHTLFRQSGQALQEDPRPDCSASFVWMDWDESIIFVLWCQSQDGNHLCSVCWLQKIKVMAVQAHRLYHSGIKLWLLLVSDSKSLSKHSSQCSSNYEHVYWKEPFIEMELYKIHKAYKNVQGPRPPPPALKSYNLARYMTGSSICLVRSVTVVVVVVPVA